ncbi:MAG TPA: HEAT repeat domain-containing protein [Tepidisphaeraceae bacterium]|nr:HEAT repeat domain-containing protein [Tepidisphaeraceae bacterium]
MKNLIPVLITLALIGCGAPAHHTIVIPPPPQPPAPPAVQKVPLDAALRDAAKKELLAADQSPDPVLRANAIEALQDTLGNESADQVMHGLADEDPLVRFASAMAAGKLKLQAAYPVLQNLVDDPDYNVQVGVRFALHRLGDTRHSHDFEILARNPSRAVRGNVAIALGLLGEPSGLRVLRAMTHDSEAIVRLQVAEAMWRLGDQDGLNILVVGTISEYPDDQMICLSALAEPRDSRVAPHLRGKLTSDYIEVGLVAARALGMVGSDAGYAIAQKGANSADPRHKSLAALAFGQIGRSDAQGILRPMLKDQSPPVRIAAATAILQLKPPI